MERHRPYCKEDGELRIGLPHKHAHLKSVRISGFFCYKDQVELALYILRNSIVLEKMEITPKLEISNNLALDGFQFEELHDVDGYRVATEFVCKGDHRNVINVVRCHLLWGPARQPWMHEASAIERWAVVPTQRTSLRANQTCLECLCCDNVEFVTCAQFSFYLCINQMHSSMVPHEMKRKMNLLKI